MCIRDRVKRKDAELPAATILLFERPVARIPLPEWGSEAAQPGSSELAKELDALSFDNDQDSVSFAASASVVILSLIHI